MARPRAASIVRTSNARKLTLNGAWPANEDDQNIVAMTLLRIPIIAALAAFLAAFTVPSTAEAGCLGPEPPEKCKCYGIKYPICFVSTPPPSCTPCLYGCTSGGVCNDEPYVDPDGLPIIATEYEAVGGVCELSDDAKLSWGVCTFAGVEVYTWTCGETREGEEWCADSRDVFFRPAD